MSETFNPRDKFFKETFARPEVAREFLIHRLLNDPKHLKTLLCHTVPVESLESFQLN